MEVDEVDLYIITFLGIFGGARWVTTNFILCTTVLLTHSAEVVGSIANSEHLWHSFSHAC